MVVGATVGQLREAIEGDRWAELAAAGLEVVEVKELGGLDEQLLEKSRQTIEAAELKVWSVHAPFGDQLDLSSPDRTIRSAAVTACREAAIRLHRLGGSVVVLHSSRLYATTSENADDRLPRMRESLERIVDEAAPLGVKAAVENLECGALGRSADELEAVLEGFDAAHTGVCLDTGHAFLQPAQGAQLVRQIAPRVITTHFHDNNGKRDEHLLPGEGSVDWDGVLEALNTDVYCGPIIFELFREDGFYERQVPKMLRIAQTHLSKREDASSVDGLK
ncbi:MAG: sugar phosphate isomerase/epimerase family protein [Candidatus Latescibacteria bacterium]|jgi:sugar phosphate isomerase/epimerase|nr:sugar phosphate isomerase/epimerase family protein [Candidatus Latescibacterota bacterium]